MRISAFLEILTSLSAQTALVFLATYALTRFVASSRTACRMWTAAYIVLLGLVLFALLMPHPRWWPRPAVELSVQATSELLTMQLAWSRVLLEVWLAGASILCGWMIVQSARVARFVKSCDVVDLNLPAFDECREMFSKLGSSRVTVLTSTSLASPFCWQFHRPVIVLPEFLLGLSTQELSFIVRHEVTHLWTGHPLQVFWQRVVEILFWFHPVVWWAARQVSMAREFACDDAAIDRPSHVTDYLRTLLLVVEHSAAESEHGSPALAFGRGHGLVVTRAHRLARIARFGWRQNTSRPGMTTAVLLWSVAVLSCFCLWIPVNVTASPRANWSPWPRWSASVLHEFGFVARDFEVYDERTELLELLEHAAKSQKYSATMISR